MPILISENTTLLVSSDQFLLKEPAVTCSHLPLIRNCKAKIVHGCMCHMCFQQLNITLIKQQRILNKTQFKSSLNMKRPDADLTKQGHSPFTTHEVCKYEVTLTFMQLEKALSKTTNSGILFICMCVTWDWTYDLCDTDQLCYRNIV